MRWKRTAEIFFLDSTTTSWKQKQQKHFPETDYKNIGNWEMKVFEISSNPDMPKNSCLSKTLKQIVRQNVLLTNCWRKKFFAEQARFPETKTGSGQLWADVLVEICWLWKHYSTFVLQTFQQISALFLHKTNIWFNLFF